MLFPADPEKARIVVGWAIARRLQLPSAGHADGFVPASIAKDAAAFAYLKDDVDRRERAGQVVGDVIKALFAMSATDRDKNVASLSSAILVYENTVVKEGGKMSESTAREYLALLKPSLHLWGAWSWDRQWPATDIQASALVERAETLRQQLVG